VGSITTYAWDFGDGAGTGSSLAESYTFTTNGSFSVELEVTNDAPGSCTHTVIKPVTISNF
jgi:PKD repeat protein